MSSCTQHVQHSSSDIFPPSEDSMLEHLKLSVPMTPLQLFKQQHANINFYNLGLINSFSFVWLNFEIFLFFKSVNWKNTHKDNLTMIANSMMLHFFSGWLHVPELSAHVASAAFRKGSSSWAQPSGTSSHDGQINLHPCSVGATVLRYKWMLPAFLPGSLWCVWCSFSPTSFENKSAAVLWVWYLHLSLILFEYMNSVIHKWGWDVSKPNTNLNGVISNIVSSVTDVTFLMRCSHRQVCLFSAGVDYCWIPVLHRQWGTEITVLRTRTKVRIINLITEKGKGKVCPSQRGRWEESMTSSILLP